MKILKMWFVLLALLGIVNFGAVVMMPQTVLAQTSAVCGEANQSFLGFPTWYKYLPYEDVGNGCDIKANIPGDAGKIGLAIFEIILRISGLLAVMFVIYGGFQYLLSQGEPEQTKNAKSTILNAFIGLVITMLATAIVNLIGRNIT